MLDKNTLQVSIYTILWEQDKQYPIKNNNLNN
jgi:hypothetical protein